MPEILHDAHVGMYVQRYPEFEVIRHVKMFFMKIRGTNQALATLLFLCTASVWGQTIVQPGAPGQDSKIVSAAALAAIPRQGPVEADTSFMQGMIMHHSQAVEMTGLMRARTHNKALLELGARISISQTDEIKFMKQWLIDRGQSVEMAHGSMNHDMKGMGAMPGMDMGGMDMGKMDMGDMPLMPGMLTPEQMKALAKASGATFDRLFLNGMIQHHGGALTMVKDLLDIPDAGQDAVLFDFVTDVDNTQRAEIRIMQGMLKEKK